VVRESFLGKTHWSDDFAAGQYLILNEEEGMQLDDPVPILNHYIAE
jgi:hypothetical protein